jgi:hypothetical protein
MYIIAAAFQRTSWRLGVKSFCQVRFATPAQNCLSQSRQDRQEDLRITVGFAKPTSTLAAPNAISLPGRSLPRQQRRLASVGPPSR